MALLFKKTDSGNPDFIALVRMLDADLAIKDGDEHAFYHQFNKTDSLRHVIVGYEDGKAVVCGALREFDAQSTEVKRMFTLPDYRNKGIATKMLQELELYARELGFEKCILETGKNQPDAIALYLKNGYAVIPNYGQYTGIANSVCFLKRL